MHVLDVTSILVCTVMLGNELAVSLFIDPAIWRLNNPALAAEMARILGKVMPLWYALGLLLIAAEAWLRRHTAGGTPLLASTILWAVTIILTLAFLVPRNNRIAAAPADWQPLHRQWDMLHRGRILLLFIAVLLLLLALL